MTYGRQSRRQSPRPRGVSLMLEVLLGFTLVGLTLLVLFSLFPMGERAVSRADRINQATSVARNLLEDRLARDYSVLDTNPATYEQGDIPLTHTKRHGQNLATDFHYKVEVTQPEPAKEVKVILVTVSWRKGSESVPSEKITLQSSKGTMW